MIVSVIGWVLWAAVLLYGLGVLASRSPDGGVRSMMWTQGLVLLASCLVTAFVPISNIYQSQFVLVVRKSLPVKSLAELIAYAKQNPGKLNYGSPGIGSTLHLISVNLCRVAGLEMTHVPYRGFAPLMQDLLGGTLDMAFVAVGTIRPMICGFQCFARRPF